MRISDWSSDVCSSDLLRGHAQKIQHGRNHDEAAAYAQKHGQYARQYAQEEWCQRGYVKARTIETPPHGECRDQRMMAALACPWAFTLLHGDNRRDGFLGHQQADAAKHQHIKRSEEHPYEIQSLKRTTNAVLCLK